MNNSGPGVVARMTVLAVIFTSVMLPAAQAETSTYDEATAESVDAEAALAVEIVNRYRQLRSSCADQQNEARAMCYYRLRIGIWDYKQALDTLRHKDIRVQSQRQLAKTP